MAVNFISAEALRAGETLRTQRGNLKIPLCVLSVSCFARSASALMKLILLGQNTDNYVI